MGFKCSLLGHSFDETDVERDREERGSEVVTVVREVERCGRCDEARVVSENKEVTSIVEPESVGFDGSDDETDDTATSTALGAAAANVDADEDGFESGSDLDEEFDAPADPAEDDAEILGDDRPSERTPGQWPDDDDEWSPEHLTRPEADEEMTGEHTVADAADADPEGDDTELADAAGDADTTDDAEFIDAEADHPSTPDTDETAADEYVCHSCGFTASTGNSPLRAGDACPACQQDYLEARSERNR